MVRIPSPSSKIESGIRTCVSGVVRGFRRACDTSAMCPVSDILLLVMLAGALVRADKLNCYFPIEYQGVYLTQSNVRPRDNKVQYTEIVVHSDEIPTWGRCYRKRGTMVVLHNILPQGNCFRCIHLYRRSANILQIYSEGLDKCYHDEDVARLTCSTDHTIWSSRVEEITLYRTKQYGQMGEGSIEAIYCPFNGHYRFLYSLQIPGEEPLECSKPTSEMNNCPFGFGLNLIFQHCTFGHMEWTYQCLGDWEGPNGERFVAFLDADVTEEEQPKYRCARYREESGTGKVYLAFSSDSTCQNNLASATQGYEILKLISVPSPPWPPQVEKSSCRFPPWLQGYWKDLYVDNNTIVYKDRNMFKTFTAKCVERRAGTDQEKYIIFTRSQCQEQYYTCIWTRKRTANVIEYQLALNPSKEYKDNLCDPSNFIDKKWDTQGKMSNLLMSSCPISGEYTGQIPDAEGLCTRLFSDCDHPEIMYYTVSSCTPNPEIYEGKKKRRPKRQSDDLTLAILKHDEGSIFPHQVILGNNSDPVNETTSPSTMYSSTTRLTTSITKSEPSATTNSPELTKTTPTTHSDSRDHTRSSIGVPITHGSGDQMSVLHNGDQRVVKGDGDQGGTLGEGNGTKSMSQNEDKSELSESGLPPAKADGQTYYDPFVYQKVNTNWRSEKNMKEGDDKWGWGDREFHSFDDETSIDSDDYRVIDVPIYPDLEEPYDEGPIETLITYVNTSKPLATPLPHPSLPDDTHLIEREPVILGPHHSVNTPLTPHMENKYTKSTESKLERQRFYPSRHTGHPDNRSSLTSRFEDRVYRCLGHWDEMDVTYSFVHRLDIEGFECFVGTILENGDEILIKEAGTTCQRDRDPYFRGMKLNKIGSCPPSKMNAVTASRRPYSPGTAWTVAQRTEGKTTRPWKPITASPSGGLSASSRITIHLLVMTCMVLTCAASVMSGV